MRYTKPNVLSVVNANSIIQDAKGHAGMGLPKQNFILPDVANPAENPFSTTGAYEADE
jgi:hypothetical protein